MAFRIVVSDPKTGKSYMMESEKTAQLSGKRVGEKINGSVLGLSGYELQITGGSDITGNPMRADVAGPISRKLLLTKGIGFRPKLKGERRKKRVRGRVISGEIVQINMKVLKQGPQPLDKLITPAEKKEKEKPGPKKEEKSEPKPEEEPKESEKPKEEKAEAKEEKKVEQPEKKPKEETKPEEKPKEEKPKEEK